MNLAPVTANTAPPPADAPKGGEPAQTGEFSNVLSRQQGHVREHGAATTQPSPRPSQAASSAEERDTPAPDETLALLAAGAVLPLMMARTELTGAAASQHGARMMDTAHGAAAPGAAADAARAILADAQALSPSAAAQRNAAGTAAATDRLTPPTLDRQAKSAAPALSDARGDQGPSTRSRATLTPTAVQSATHANSPKADAAQTAFAQIAAAIRLNTQPTAAAPSAIDRLAIQDATHAMAGATQAQGSGITLPNTALLSSPAVATPLSNPAWAADFSRQFVSMTQGRNTSEPHTIELRLDPPSLGPVRITLHISDSIAQAAFVSPHLAVRQAIENALPQLQQQLAEAGLSLGQASVNDQQGGQQGSEQSSSQGSLRNASIFALDGGGIPTTQTLPPTRQQAPRSPDALVDTFA